MKNKQAFTLSRHAEFISASSRYQNNKTLKQVQGDGRKGFTLIELLVVVLIIGILGAIAVPQYQRAVLKSRFSGMMPIAKALAESNEVYFLDHGEYAENPADLLVAGRDKNASAYPDGTKILMYSDAEDLSFVRSENDNIPAARYVVYQKHSKNFPDTTWCEANDTHAEGMCQALGGQFVEGGSSSGSTSEDNNWKAYLLSGTAREGDSFAGAGSGGSGAGTGGASTAPALDPETQAKVNAFMTTNSLCTNIEGICHDNGDGTISRCLNYDAQKHYCIPNYPPDISYYNIGRVYNADGVKIEERNCHTINNGRECGDMQLFTYDPVTGTSVSVKRRKCQEGVTFNLDTLTCPDGKYDFSDRSNNQDYDDINKTWAYCTTFGPNGECNPS